MGKLLSHLSDQPGFHTVYKVTFRKGRDHYYKATQKVYAHQKRPFLCQISKETETLL